jgi:hypothetical protein
VGIRWAFVQQAALLEGCGPIRALSRSSELILFLPAAIVFIQDTLFAETAAAAFPPLWMRIWYPVGLLIFYAIAIPIFTTAQTLLYFDLRVRKEGYNIDALANEIGLPATSTDDAATPL